jgi:hypothetical protein
MSFAMTTPQIRAGTKTVTRRLGWVNLKPGEILMACEKCQGIPKGEKVVKIRAIRVVAVNREFLYDIDQRAGDVKKEGFPDMLDRWFVEMFMKANHCRYGQKVNRIEFEYVEKGVTL